METMTGQNAKPLALITGGTKGFGKSIAESLASRFRIALIYKSDKANADEFTKVLTSKGALVLSYQCDLADQVLLEKTYQKIIADFKTEPFVLINSAGIAHKSLSVMESLAEHRQLFEVNYFAAVQLSKLVLPAMLRAKSGRIINLSTNNVLINTRGSSAYCASKSALEKFSEVLGGEVARSGVTVNCVRPGMAATEMSTDYLKSLSEEDTKELLQPSGELISPEEIARTVEFLIDSKQINSSVITVDTGHALFKKI